MKVVRVTGDWVPTIRPSDFIVWARLHRRECRPRCSFERSSVFARRSFRKGVRICPATSPPEILHHSRSIHPDLGYVFTQKIHLIAWKLSRKDRCALSWLNSRSLLFSPAFLAFVISLLRSRHQQVLENESACHRLATACCCCRPIPRDWLCVPLKKGILVQVGWNGERRDERF